MKIIKNSGASSKLKRENLTKKLENLGEKDKKRVSLIGSLIIILITIAILRPMIIGLGDTSAKVSEAKVAKMDMETKLSGLEDRKNYLAEIRKGVAKDSKRFYSPMESQEIEKMITFMANEKGLAVNDLTIYMPTGFLILDPYMMVNEEKENSSKEGKANSTETADATGSSDENAKNNGELTGMTAAQLNCRFEGTRQEIENIVNEITQNYSSMRVTSFDIDEDRSREGVFIGNVILDFYMFTDK